jgi:hypothetical protein
MLYKMDLCTAFEQMLEFEPAWLEQVENALRNRQNLRWKIPPRLFQEMLRHRSSNLTTANTKFPANPDIRNSVFDNFFFTCLVLDISNSSAEEEAHPVLVPLLLAECRIEGLNSIGNVVQERTCEVAFACLNRTLMLNNPVLFSGSVIPYFKICPIPPSGVARDLFYGHVTHIRVTLDYRSSSLTPSALEGHGIGYPQQWSSFEAIISQSISLQRIARQRGPQKTNIEFRRERRDDRRLE